ncbi:MAG TPA: Ig-like domain-containing protein [Verrucomicrobiae bacterium]
MTLRSEIFKPFLCLALLLLFAAGRALANTVNVYWTSDDGFSTGSVVINAGDGVNIANLDSTYDLDLTGTAPESWYADVPPESSGSYYYVPIVYSVPGTYSFSDEFGDSVTVVVNSTAPPPPLTVAITAPTNDAVFIVPGAFTVTVAPSGGATPYAEVDFYVGTNHTGVAYGSPYSATVSNLPLGSYNVSAVVTDSDFNTATNSIQVTVQPLLVTNYIVPVVCGSIDSSGNVYTGGYLDAESSGDQGTLEFAEFNVGQCISIQLEVNAYAEPLWSPQVNIYGFDGGNGALSISNYNSGSLIGVLSVPEYPGYGRAQTVDVTSFVKSTKGPFFGLYLIATSGSGDLFSSLSENYGLPPELYAISLAPPPPPTVAFTGNKLLISWSTNNAFGATLQTSTSIAPGAAWVPVNLTPTLIGNQWVVTNSISSGNHFFRLADSQ